MSALPLPALPAPLPDAEFPLTAADFDRIRKLIHARAGISLHGGKRALVYSRLSRRLRATGHRAFGPYLDDLERLSGAPAEAEWQAFVNCLTTNLTAFFRELHHFHALREQLLARSGRAPRIWCNAASTGEEAYSLAMTLVDTLGAGAAQSHLLCTDINTQVLGDAVRGVYPADARGLGPELLRRHFMRGTGPNAGFIRVRSELARMVEFRPFNLMASQWSSLGAPFEIVFCRNVMIYFDGPTQRRVLERTHAQMVPGGLLVVGHSENFTESRDLFRLRGQTTYERL